MEFLCVDYKHWFNENDAVFFVDVDFAASAHLSDVGLIILLWHGVSFTTHSEVELHWTFILTIIVKFEIDFQIFFRLNNLIIVRSIWAPILILINFQHRIIDIAYFLLLSEDLIRVILVHSMLRVHIKIINANRLSILSKLDIIHIR